MSEIRKIGYSISISDEILNPETDARRVVRIPKSSVWLADRAAFVAEWKALTDRGLESGFLDRDPCYECGGEIVPTTEDAYYEYKDGVNS